MSVVLFCYILDAVLCYVYTVYCDCNDVCDVFPQGRPGIIGHKGEKGDSVGLPVSFSHVSPKKYYYYFIRKK